MKRRCKAVVAGATGVVGRRLGEHLASIGEWDVIGIARGAPKEALPFPLIELDLTSAAECREKLAELREVTHILYAGRYRIPRSPSRSRSTWR